ncbi:MAG: hypothetical protein KC416_02375 [Myxococcales bacterium]|nr:hypothetical protein [Myxococcales bacterium]
MASDDNKKKGWLDLRIDPERLDEIFDDPYDEPEATIEILRAWANTSPLFRNHEIDLRFFQLRQKLIRDGDTSADAELAGAARDIINSSNHKWTPRTDIKGGALELFVVKTVADLYACRPWGSKEAVFEELLSTKMGRAKTFLYDEARWIGIRPRDLDAYLDRLVGVKLSNFKRRVQSYASAVKAPEASP